jgi:hypothetical protein
MITVIAPHARPAFAQNLLDAYRRQREHVECRLVVVENGAALGQFPATPRGEAVTILQSAPHQADAMNVALSWLRKNGGGAWARFDDDDYYGPGYLRDVEATLLRTGADVVGKPWSFVMFDDGLWRFSLSRNEQWADGFDFTGGTLAACSADVIDFARRLDDDLQFCRDMRERGAKLWSGSRWHYCYDRRTREERRVWPARPVAARKAFGGTSEYYGLVPIEAVDQEVPVPCMLFEEPTMQAVGRELTGDTSWE